MNYKILFLSLFIIFSCTNSENKKVVMLQNMKKEKRKEQIDLYYKKDSIKFFEYYNNYIYEKQIPGEFNYSRDTLKASLKLKGITEEHYRNYICSDQAFCSRTTVPGENLYVHLNKIVLSDNYYSALYIQINKSSAEEKIVLINYSKEKFNIKSKITLTGYSKRVDIPYELSSHISKDLTITSRLKYFYINKSQWWEYGKLPNSKYPGYFYVNEYNSKYKINTDGSISLINEEFERYVSLIKNGVIKHDVEIENYKEE